MMPMKSAALCVSIGLAALLLAAQTKSPAPQAGDHLIGSLEGRDLYVAYCASCHGASARGDGPAAKALKARPTDLTRLSSQHDGVYPKDAVRRYIAGENEIASHGSREMPVWGPIFSQVETDRDYGRVRVENLVNYIQTLQTQR